MLTTPAPRLLRLTGLYESSAIRRLADGRLRVVQDEKCHSFSLVTVLASGAAAMG